jgi:YkoY family integral membrane protein
MLDQTFSVFDLGTIGVLAVLEGAMSLDNAVVLGILAGRLGRDQQGKALSYGLIGSLLFRFVAIALATYLLHWRIVTLLGGAYLVYIACKHLFMRHPRVRAAGRLDAGSAGESLDEEPSEHPRANFWSTVLVIELTDIAFAVDSILAAIALVGPAPANAPSKLVHPKMWVIVVGGMLGVVAIRFAAAMFIRLMKRFPRFNSAAYWMVLVVGLKLLLDYAFNIDFSDVKSPACWIFWVVMIGCFSIGFMPVKDQRVMVTEELEA